MVVNDGGETKGLEEFIVIWLAVNQHILVVMFELVAVEQQQRQSQDSGQSEIVKATDAANHADGRRLHLVPEQPFHG